MTPGVDWPSKDEAEKWEIHGFIDHYRRLPGQRTVDVVRRQERPDWIVRDIASGELIGGSIQTRRSKILGITVRGWVSGSRPPLFRNREVWAEV